MICFSFAGHSIKILGMMSGTSGDGIDATLVEFFHDGSFKLLWQDSYNYDDAQFKRIQTLMKNADAGDIALGGAYVAELHQRACREFFARNSFLPDLIAVHGQTVFHHPKTVLWDDIPVSGTLQLMNGSLLAQKTGIPVVCNFRAADMVVGGQGAPLVPFADLFLFGRNVVRDLLVLNIGGMANITAIKANGNRTAVVGAFDTGPGNVLIDAFMQTSGRGRFDHDGSFAASGKTLEKVLRKFLADPYFKTPPPKSTGREYFNHLRLSEILAEAGNEADPADIASTLLDITVISICEAVLGLKKLIKFPADLLVAGGGALNSELMKRLNAGLEGNCVVATTEKAGVPVMAREAMAFAILGHAFVKGEPANVPCATGACKAVLLGEYHPVIA